MAGKQFKITCHCGSNKVSFKMVTDISTCEIVAQIVCDRCGCTMELARCEE